MTVIDEQPGLQKQVFESIQNYVNNPQGWMYKLCVLHMDEMEIKKQTECSRTHRKVYGFTDIGYGPNDDDDNPTATKVVAVGLSCSWRLPVAYYLINGAKANNQTMLIKAIISKLWECGSLVVVITFHGLPANTGTMLLLGSNKDASSNKHSFPHPSCPTASIVPIFDACYMMKLARNVLCDYQEISFPKVGKAVWQHITSLHKKQDTEGLRLANKLTEAHINYKTQKMKVKLALISANIFFHLCYSFTVFKGK